MHFIEFGDMVEAGKMLVLITRKQQLKAKIHFILIKYICHDIIYAFYGNIIAFFI